MATPGTRRGYPEEPDAPLSGLRARRSRVWGPVLTAVAVALVAGCAGGSDGPVGTAREASSASSSPSSQQSGAVAGGHASPTPGNSADRGFAKAMAALGGRAVDLAELASTSSGSPLVRAVADDIRRAQLRRVSDSVAWLRGWTPSPSTSGDGPSRSTTGHGAVGPDDLRRLRRSAGLAFDRLWLRLMARQQRAEARAARVEVGGGRNAAARALARTVITGNRAQLTRLRGLLVDEGD